VCNIDTKEGGSGKLNEEAQCANTTHDIQMDIIW
jgi:hypothetical protein